ncbi:hypothetical protein C8Q78DRAFT_262313 [Trametes maxima]|nr:hypothetical protein C8Q78DRAFT_262313 [Trametes maxima]
MAVNGRATFLAFEHAARQMIEIMIHGAASESSLAAKWGMYFDGMNSIPCTVPCFSPWPSNAGYSCLLCVESRGSWIIMYFSSKDGRMRLMLRGSVELRKYNITVNVYCPGVIKTPINGLGLVHKTSYTHLGM